MSGGLVSGNTAYGYHGGGIFNQGVVNINGGSVTGNEAKAGLSGGGQGGGILQNGVMNVSGTPYVAENTGVKGDNLYLRPGKVITVTGTLEDSALFRVYREDGAGAVTAGFSGAAAGCFQSDREDCYIVLGDDGQEIGRAHV